MMKNGIPMKTAGGSICQYSANRFQFNMSYESQQGEQRGLPEGPKRIDTFVTVMNLDRLNRILIRSRRDL